MRINILESYKGRQLSPFFYIYNMNYLIKFENFDSIRELNKKIGSLRRNINKDEMENNSKFKKISMKIEDGIEPTNIEIKELDHISGYSDLYEKIKKLTKSCLESFKGLLIDDIEDRLLGYFDEIPMFIPSVNFCLHIDDSTSIINSNKLTDQKYLISKTGRNLLDVLFFTTHEKSLDYYLSNLSPGIYISFNGIGNRNSHKKYSLEKLNNLSDKIVNRFKSIYPIDKIIYDHAYYYKGGPMSASFTSDYKLILYLKKQQHF